MEILESALVFRDNHTLRGKAPAGIVLHHAAGTGSVEDVHRWHLQNGWAGIGYHFYVRRDGKVYRGRPEEWTGAHAVGANDQLGICAEGNFERERMKPAQKQAIAELVRALRRKYGALACHRHSEYGSTACPGRYFPFEEIVREGAGDGAAAKDANLVKRFQSACLADGIPLPVYGADGVWERETEGAARHAVASGSRGERVRLAQQVCMEAKIGLPCGADGIFGAHTAAAVREFQKQKGLVIDGIAGIKTWKAMLGV